MKKILLTVVLVISSLQVYAENILYQSPEKSLSLLVNMCKVKCIPVWIGIRLVSWESGFDNLAENYNPGKKTWDRGLLQLNSANMKEWKWKYNFGRDINPFNIYDNLWVGLSHLEYLYKVFGNWYDAIGAYNMGETGYKKYLCGEKTLPDSTRNELQFIFGKEI